jgi:hypothetical protein
MASQHILQGATYEPNDQPNARPRGRNDALNSGTVTGRMVNSKDRDQDG